MNLKGKGTGLLLFFQVFFVFLVSNIKCNVHHDPSWNWTHPVQITTLNENGNLVTVDHIKFKPYNFRYACYSEFLNKNVPTKLECGILCMEHLRCLSWIFNVFLEKCSLYDYKFEAYPLKAYIKSTYSSSFASYEIEVNIAYN